ncbi:MAG: hypothetical protein AAF826_10710 [Pseudomonadota bacterium]
MDKGIIVTTLSGGVSVFETVLTIASWAKLPDPKPQLMLALDPVADDPGEIIPSVRSLAEGYGAGVIENPGQGFDQDLVHCLSFLALRQVDDVPFLVIAPGMIFHGVSDLTATEFTASKDILPHWPKEFLYGPKRAEIWRQVFDAASEDIKRATDPSHHENSWRHWPELDGMIVAGPSATTFGACFAEHAQHILDQPPNSLETQQPRKNLHRIVLPLVLVELEAEIQKATDLSRHALHVQEFRRLAYFYSSAPEDALAHFEAAVSDNKFKKILKLHEPYKRLIYQGKGRDLRDRFYEEGGQPPRRLMRRLRRHTNWWVR